MARIAAGKEFEKAVAVGASTEIRRSPLAVTSGLVEHGAEREGGGDGVEGLGGGTMGARGPKQIEPRAVKGRS
jgi:hypothetical protein